MTRFFHVLSRTLVLAVVLTAAFSCSMDAGKENVLSSIEQTAAVTDPMVVLDRSAFTMTSSQLPYHMYFNAEGFVKVKNVGFTKKVTIHYSNGGQWLDQTADYSHQGVNGYEFWKFKISVLVYKTPSQDTLRFAIKYNVNGQEYWDNNGGKDYDGKVNQFTHIVLKNASMTSTSLGNYTVESVLSGEVLVKNYAYQKEINIVYSKRETGTETWANAPLTYVGPGENGAEIWKFNVVIRTYKGSPEQCCFQYKVNGTEYWDNNLNRNYKAFDYYVQ